MEIFFKDNSFSTYSIRNISSDFFFFFAIYITPTCQSNFKIAVCDRVERPKAKDQLGALIIWM